MDKKKQKVVDRKKHITVYFLPHILDKVMVEAEADKRSMSNQVEFIVEKHFKKQEK